MDSIDENYIRSLVWAGKTHREIAGILQAELPSTRRGLSERNVRQYCSKRNIHRQTSFELDQTVRQCVEEVGPSYGRKMMAGYIYSRYGMKVGQRRLQSSLRRVSPVYHEQRRNDLVRRANPVPYYSPYHGHKLHIDQNEKLKDFGVTHNLPAERKWVEINQRTNYPIKEALIDMQRRLVINMADPIEKFCVSFVSIIVAEVGVAKAVDAWNEHPIEVRQYTNPHEPLLVTVKEYQTQGQNCPVPLSPLRPEDVPTTEEAIAMYEANGGRLTRESTFGEDPLRDHPTLVAERDRLFQESNPDVNYIQGNLANGYPAQFEAAVLSFIDITKRLS
ncbi:hypothetical protein AC249_AIPGENE13490 [Exaiptasia diaphana]|nr:hypothetical protein AC249_AIPGENE13490 [Exaiptasia diaphana]